MVALAVLVLAAPAVAGESELSLMVGMKALVEDRLDDAGVSGGLLYGLRTNHDFGWPVLLAVDACFSQDDATESVSGAFPLTVVTNVHTSELFLGVRRYFRQAAPLRPYLGGGLSLAQMRVRQVESGSFGPGAEFSNTVVDDGDASAGYWAGGGLGYFMGKLVIGVDLRWSDTTAKIPPVGGDESLDLQSGGYAYAAFLGYHW